jgi:hypothetical protein
MTFALRSYPPDMGDPDEDEDDDFEDDDDEGDEDEDDEEEEEGWQVRPASGLEAASDARSSRFLPHGRLTSA